MAIFDLFKSETRAIGGSDPALRAWARGDDIDIHRSNATSSGQKVDEDSALGLSTLYSCVAIRAEALASMPVRTYMTEGEKRVPTPSPIWMSRPNPEEDWAAYISAASWSLDLHGNLYEIVVRDRSNRVRELWMIDPGEVDVSREMAGAPLTYRVKGEVFTGEIRHRWLHRRPGDLIGSSPIAFARESIGLGLSAQQFGAEFFGSGGVPQGIATIPGSATTEQLREVKAEFTRKSRLPKVLQGGMTYQATSVAPNESQFLESRRFTAAEICAIFRVPPEFVAIGVEGSSLLYQNVSSSWLAFIRRALMAPMRILESSYSELLPPGSRFRFVPDVYLKPDTGARYDAYKVAVEGGWMTPNEVRRLEDQDDVEFGDTLYAPKKETAESVQTPEEAPAEDEAAAAGEGADVVPFGVRADRDDEARHGSHNQKDHGRKSGKGGGGAVTRESIAERHAGGGRFSSDEIAAMSPDEFKMMLSDAAGIQRGAPERAMIEIQKQGGGVYSHAVEHTGDLTHRINEKGGALGSEFVKPKVDTMLDTLNHPYGFEKEMGQNNHGNAPLRDRTPEQQAAKVAELGQAYADAHREVPVYNLPSEFARNAAIALGEQNFAETRFQLRELKSAVDDPAVYKSLMSQDAAIDFADFTPAEQRHGSHNQKDHGRGSGKGGGGAASVARQGLPASDFDGPVVARTIAMNLSPAQMEALKPASNMGEYQEQYDKGGLARHAAVGEQIVKDAASFKGHDGIEATSGIGRSWTTEPDKIEHLMAVQPGQTEVRITAKPRTSDIVASNVKGNEFGLESQGDMASGESEVRLKGGAPVDIVNVQVRNPYPGEKWLTVWDSAEQRHGSHNQKDHGRNNGVSGMARTLAEPDGGFTVDYGGTPIRTGWSVAQAGTTTPLKASEFVDNPRAAKKAIADKIRNAPEGMDGVGAWHEPETGIIHLDYVKVLPKGEKAAAIKMGKEQNQLSIASLDAIEAGDWDNAIVDTGGTGDDLRGKIPAYGTQTVGHVPSTTEKEAERRGDRSDGREDLQRGVGQASGLIALLGRINAREDRHADHDQKTHGRKTAGGGAGGRAGRRLDPDALTGESAYSAGSGAAGVKASGAIEAASRLTKAERQAVADELNSQEYGRITGDLDASNRTIVEYGLHHEDLGEGFKEIPLGVRMQINAADAKIIAMSNEANGSSREANRQASDMGEAIDAYRGVRGAVGINGTSVKGDIKALSAEIENATGVTPASALISSVNRQWARSSQSIVSEAMQLEVAEARGDSSFSMPIGGGAKGYTDVPDSMGWLPTGSIEAASNLRAQIPTSIKSVRLATERQTAAVMKESGISPTDTVTLYRGASGGTITQLYDRGPDGMGPRQYGKASEITTNPLSSWSESRETAQNFGGNVIKVEVPASQIYGVSSWSGHGSLSEREVILYDDPGDFSEYSVENRAKAKRINLDEFDADWIKQVGQGDTAYTADELRHADHDQKTHGRKTAGGGSGGSGGIPGGPGISDSDKNGLFINTRPDSTKAGLAAGRLMGDGKTMNANGTMSIEGMNADGSFVTFDANTERKIAARWDDLGVTHEQLQANLEHSAKIAMGFDPATGKFDADKLAEGTEISKWYSEQGGRLEALSKEQGLSQDSVTAAATVLSAGRLWDGVANGNYETAANLVGILKKNKPLSMSQAEADFMDWRKGKATKSTSKIGLDGDHSPGERRPSELSSGQLVETLYAKSAMRGYDSFDSWASDTEFGKKSAPPRAPSDYPLFTSKGTKQVKQAVSVLRGEVSAREAIAGPKYSSFYSNLRRPDLDYSSTNDTWHYRVMAGNLKLNPAVKKSTLQPGTIRELTVKDYAPNGKVSTAQDHFQNGAASKSAGLTSGDGMFRDSTKISRDALTSLQREYPDQFGSMKLHEVQAVVWVHYGGGQSQESIRNGNWDEALATLPS